MMRRQLIILISLLLLSCSPVSKYKDLKEVKDWAPDIREFEQLDRTEKYQDDAVMFAGSSSIRLWEHLSPLGYELWTKIIKGELDTILQVKPN